MPKINPKADFAIAKGWATSHVVAAVIVAAIFGLLVGLAVG